MKYTVLTVDNRKELDATKKNNLSNPGYRILDCSRSRRPLVVVVVGYRHITSLNKRLKVLTILSQGSDLALEIVVFFF